MRARVEDERVAARGHLGRQRREPLVDGRSAGKGNEVRPRVDQLQVFLHRQAHQCGHTGAGGEHREHLGHQLVREPRNDRTKECETERRRDAQRELPVVGESDLEHLAGGNQKRERAEDLQLPRAVRDVVDGEQGCGDA